MKTEKYNRDNAINYAQKWALKRNPKYYDFDGLGGDCTNFASQCLFEGAPQMNFNGDEGWYYYSSDNRAAAWSSVDYFRKFLLNNASFGPFGELTTLSQAQTGDFIQLKNFNNEFYHTLIISKIYNNQIYVCAHTYDVLDEVLSSYYYHSLAVIRIVGYRTS